MWTKENRGRYDRSRLRYRSDLTDEEWAITAACRWLREATRIEGPWRLNFKRHASCFSRNSKAGSSFQIGVSRGRRIALASYSHPANVLRRAGGDETIARQDETIFPDWRRWPETDGGIRSGRDLTTGFDHVGTHRHPLSRVLLGTSARDAEVCSHTDRNSSWKVRNQFRPLSCWPP